MKNLKNIFKSILMLTFIVSCSDDFLDKTPQDSLAETNTFQDNNSIKSYTWQLYEMFEAHNEPNKINGNNRPGTGYGLDRESDADLVQKGTQTSGSAYAWGRVTVPSADSDYEEAYVQIRKANLLLKNVPNSDLDEVDKNHWLSVGLFFKAFNYFKLVQLYGEVIWLEEVVTNDSELLYAPKTPRNELTANILDDLIWAEAHIKDNGSNRKEVDQSVVNALISQFGLFEGTWRKYHGLGDETTYLEASKAASEKLIAKFPNLHPNFDELQNSVSLEGAQGIVLFKEYNELENWSNMSTTFRASNSTWDITRKGIDKFLTKDGLPVTNPNTPEYLSDRDAYAEFRNRDTRILISTPPVYKINKTSNKTWTFTEDPADSEWFDKLVQVSQADGKSLPDLNWVGNVVSDVPNFNQNANAGYNRTFSGYRVWKHYNTINTGTSSKDYADAPIYRMGEILVNHAEATFELGEFNQSVADATINKLRVRGEVAPMQVASIDASFDPSRDPSVDPILWEIRRERAVELLAEGFRREDLRRWKKMNYVEEVKLGRWITASSQNGLVPIQGNAQEGYVQTVPGTPPAFPEYYYLFPLPSDQLVLNPQLEQNPGW